MSDLLDKAIKTAVDISHRNEEDPVDITDNTLGRCEIWFCKNIKSVIWAMVVLIILTFLMLLISFFISLSSSNEIVLVNEKAELNKSLQESNKQNIKLQDKIQVSQKQHDILKSIVSGKQDLTIAVLFGGGNSTKKPVYFSYEDVFKNKIFFNTRKPNFRDVVKKNGGISLNFEFSEDLKGISRYALIGALVEVMPKLEFISTLRGKPRWITLSRDWIDWKGSKITGKSMDVPLKIDFRQFRNTVIENASLSLPHVKLGGEEK